MNLYLNIDGVLLNQDSNTRADYSIELIDYITNEFDCYWLRSHCNGDTKPTIKHLANYFPSETIEKLKTIKPTYWDKKKTEGIDFDKSFIWLDDHPLESELSVLYNFGASDSLYLVNLGNKEELLIVLNDLKGIIEKKHRKRRNAKITGLIFFAILILS